MVKKQKVRIERFYEADKNASYQAKWLADILNQSHLNLSDLARAIHVSKQTVSNWLQDKCKMTYSNIAAICYKLFNKLDVTEDPDVIYNRMKSDAQAHQKGE